MKAKVKTTKRRWVGDRGWVERTGDTESWTSGEASSRPELELRIREELEEKGWDVSGFTLENEPPHEDDHIFTGYCHEEDSREEDALIEVTATIEE